VDRNEVKKAMMKKYATVLGAGLALLAGVGLVALRAADNKTLHADTKKQADEVGKKDWDDMSKAGAAIAKKYMLDDVMYQFKPRNAKKNPGIGIGETPGVIKPDGIEQKLQNMAKRVSPADVKAAKDLKRMAEISAAIASIAVNLPPPVMGAKNPAAWKKHSKEMFVAAKALSKVLDSPKPKADDIKKAVINLNATCTDCHSIFRDSQ
jgi:cytochrome c556